MPHSRGPVVPGTQRNLTGQSLNRVGERRNRDLRHGCACDLAREDQDETRLVQSRQTDLTHDSVLDTHIANSPRNQIVQVIRGSQ